MSIESHESQNLTVRKSLRVLARTVVLDHPFTMAHWESSQGGSELVQTKSVPGQLFDRYINAAMKRTMEESLEDGSIFVEIRGLEGVWGRGPSHEDALRDLKEALHDWLLLKIEASDRDILVLDNIDLNDI